MARAVDEGLGVPLDRDYELAVLGLSSSLRWAMVWTSAASATDRSAVLWASITRSSMVPKCGRVRTSHHRNEGSGNASHRGYHHPSLLYASEILDENRFLAARDGMDAQLIDPVAETRVPARTQLKQLLEVATPHAQELGCEHALEFVAEMALEGGAQQQRQVAQATSLAGLMRALAAGFSPA